MLEMGNPRYVDKCLKMPHAEKVGYFFIENEKIFVAIQENEDCYFNKDQQELVEEYQNQLDMRIFMNCQEQLS